MASFLHDARARIQHTNKLSLAPKDLKNLADIIATEKSVVSTSSKLSVDYRKAADALKEWGTNEGDDLADILPKLSILFGHLADAQSRFSDHDSTYRIHFKSIRMREESLTTLKKSKETIQAKIVGFEKKITKMSSENKDLPALTARLQESRSELVSLENSISIEEVKLSDFKRETVREGLSLRLGAMLELAEKMTIVCEFGRMLTAEVPIDRTAPGSSRAPYRSAIKTQDIVEEAQHCLTQVVFNPAPNATRTNLETSPKDPSSRSPTSDCEHPTTPHQTADIPHRFSSELPPLYFGGAKLGNPAKPHHTDDTPNHLNSTHDIGTSEAPTPLHSLVYPSYPLERREQTGYPEPSSHTSRGVDSVAAPSRNPPHGSFMSEASTSHPENAFYVLGRDGVPQSTGPGNLAEFIHPPSNPPINSIASQPEGLGITGATPLDDRDVPRERVHSSPPGDVADRSVSAHSHSETGSVMSERLPYFPRHHELALSPKSSATVGSEGRTTNAGAFRRAVGNSASNPSGSNGLVRGSNQSIITTDEALTTAAITSVHPLHIHKRDSRIDQH